jgi:NRPS condensation-like uncharacterized protein
MVSQGSLVTPVVIDHETAPTAKLRYLGQALFRIDCLRDRELIVYDGLGTFEHFRTILHDLGYHNNVCLLATYQNVNLTHHLLLHALEHAIRQHPALSVQISNSEIAKPYFVELLSINLDEVVEYIDVPGTTEERHAWIDEFLSAQHSLGFHDKKNPLWRVVVLNNVGEDVKGQEISTKSVDIAFVWHHVIGDGKSGLAVHNSIAEGLISPFYASGPSPIPRSDLPEIDGKLCTLSPIIEPPLNELFPSLEQLFQMPASRSTKFKKWLSVWFGSCLPLQPRSQSDLDAKEWSGAPYHDEAPIKTLIRHITIPAPSTSFLIKLCHMRGTTVTAFLQALIGRTISRYYDHEWRLRCATAISMRRFMDSDLNIGEQEMGLWVSAFHFELEREELSDIDQDKERFWELARKNRKRITNEIRKGDTDLGIGGLRFIPDFRQNLKAKIGKKREDSFAVTNLGVFDGRLITDSSHGEIDETRIGGMIFSQSCHVNGSALQFCIMSVRNGEMTVGVSWQEGTVPIKDTECIASALKAELIKFAEE